MRPDLGCHLKRGFRGAVRQCAFLVHRRQFRGDVDDAPPTLFDAQRRDATGHLVRGYIVCIHHVLDDVVGRLPEPHRFAPPVLVRPDVGKGQAGIVDQNIGRTERVQCHCNDLIACGRLSDVGAQCLYVVGDGAGFRLALEHLDILRQMPDREDSVTRLGQSECNGFAEPPQATGYDRHAFHH